MRRWALLVMLLLSFLATGAIAAQAEPELATAERLRLGQRMYQEGILPSGEPMQAYVNGDVPVQGTSFTCVSCHLHSGIGSFEANIAASPVNGRILFQPRKPYIKGFEYVPAYHKYASHFPERPAYTDDTLAELITAGIDPTGRSVVKVMPRYDINDDDIAILIDYLKSLSDQLSPGVSDTEIKFATVIAGEVPEASVEAMITPLQFHISRKNSLALAYKNHPRMARMAYNMIGPEIAGKTFTLSRWLLKGAPDTWRAQLEEYYRAEPVFALLGGITDGDWEPVHRFCEDNRIPDLFPIVDYPVISSSDWYTLYFSRGIRQEGEAGARYLHSMYELFAGQPLVQITRDSRRGHALADGFHESWGNTGHPAVIDIILKEGEPLTPEQLQQIISEHKPAVLVIWDDEALLAAMDGLTVSKDSPKFILASGTYMGEGLWKIPEQLRDMLFVTYPYRLPQDEVRFDPTIKSVLQGKPLDTTDPRIIRQACIIGEVLDDALVKMRGEFYRDYFFDTIGMMADASFPLYERLSFGHGQRYASKGCYIVQLGKGVKPQLERLSEWVTH
ncbi:MAG: amino acid ABC transporter substrate-binding protein [Proteobacteria bacterium]|nr:amino acid ABC transporter substrate-binding protein [Pseudomonadota bacterium]